MTMNPAIALLLWISGLVSGVAGAFFLYAYLASNSR